MKGIYKIECLVNGKIYIGSTTVCFKNRFKKHRQRLRHNYHENDYLQKAWNKYGDKNFTFVILEKIEDNEQIKAREAYWLNIYFSKGKDFCFNLSDQVNGGNTLKTDEIRKKHSENVKKSYTPELLKKRSVDSLSRVDSFKISTAKAKKTKRWKDNHRNSMIQLSKRPSWLKKTRENTKLRMKKVKTDLGELFNSVTDAAKQTGAQRSNIRLCIRGKIETCMGRKWEYC